MAILGSEVPEKSNCRICFIAGVPNPRAARQEVSGGRASEASSTTPHHSPSLPLPPEPSPTIPPTPPTVRGRTVFHEPGPWYLKGWGPLLYWEWPGSP